MTTDAIAPRLAGLTDLSGGGCELDELVLHVALRADESVDEHMMVGRVHSDPEERLRAGNGDGVHQLPRAAIYLIDVLRS
jgi:hypothetical protein